LRWPSGQVQEVHVVFQEGDDVPSTPAIAQSKIHLAGRDASALVSLLASGNKDVKEALTS
jgi:hypothetical protein